jgi:hypothetical protein
MPGVMWSLLAGALTLNRYFAFSVAWINWPLRWMNCLSDGLPVRWLGSSLVPTPDVAPLSAIVNGIVPSIIPWRSSLSSTPMMYCRFDWWIMESTLLASIPFACCCSSLFVHFAAILFWLRASATDAMSIVSLNTSWRLALSGAMLVLLGLCYLTWHGSGDRQE